MQRNPDNGLTRGWLFALHLASAVVPGAACGQESVPSYVTFYPGNDELAVPYLIGNNAAPDHDIRVLQVRSLAFRGKYQTSAYLAHGNYIFDVLGLPGASGSGWSATLAFAPALTNKTALRLELGQGVESDTFPQQSFAVSLRYSL
jgi:hypothetical protein